MVVRSKFREKQSRSRTKRLSSTIIAERTRTALNRANTNPIMAGRGGEEYLTLGKQQFRWLSLSVLSPSATPMLKVALIQMVEQGKQMVVEGSWSSAYQDLKAAQQGKKGRGANATLLLNCYYDVTLSRNYFYTPCETDISLLNPE